VRGTVEIGGTPVVLDSSRVYRYFANGSVRQQYQERPKIEEPGSQQTVREQHLSYQYDNLGHTLSVKQGESTTSNTFHSLGFLQTQTDPIGNITAYTYDFLGRQSSDFTFLDDGLARYRTRRYDDFGNLEQMIDRNGRTIQFDFDSLGRRVGVTVHHNHLPPLVHGLAVGAVFAEAAAGSAGAFAVDGVTALFLAIGANRLRM
jgi:YD repeat-containing protein